jgi:hypothetical protein
MASNVFQIYLHDLKRFGRIPVDKFPPLLPDLMPKRRGDLLFVSPEDMPDCPRRKREALLLLEITREPRWSISGLALERSSSEGKAAGSMGNTHPAGDSLKNSRPLSEKNKVAFFRMYFDF